MKLTVRLLALSGVAVLVSCAEPREPAAPEQPARAGSHFDETGTVILHVGQPCTPQIMFDFEPSKSRSTVWLGAPMRETTMLTDAAKRHRRIHIAGNWHRGKQAGCAYVAVTSVESAK